MDDFLLNAEQVHHPQSLGVELSWREISGSTGHLPANRKRYSTSVNIVSPPRHPGSTDKLSTTACLESPSTSVALSVPSSTSEALLTRMFINSTTIADFLCSVFALASGIPLQCFKNLVGNINTRSSLVWDHRSVLEVALKLLPVINNALVSPNKRDFKVSEQAIMLFQEIGQDFLGSENEDSVQSK